jgi:dTDP-4-dehydrorhamnose 3,5-epimerase
MRFEAAKVTGAFLIEPEPITDERGFFARIWCRDEFAAHGLNPTLAQANVSFNHRKGTLRGMHYQAAPHQEAKLVRCTRGAIWDIVLDLRPDSPTYRAWTGAELSDANRAMLYVPEGCAHGFLTLTDAAEVAYQMSVPYAPEAARGVRYDDPAFDIEWPGEVVVINQRDASYPDVDS